MDIRKVEYFLKVAEYRSISRAADVMHISHQGLSKQILLLEKELGITLMERTSQGIRLTDAGEKLFASFHPISKEIEYQSMEFEKYVKYKKGTLRIAYLNALSYHRVIEPVLDKLYGKREDLHIDVLATDIGVIHDLLLNNGVDAAIAPMIDESDWSGMIIRPLATVPLRIIVSDKHPWFGKKSVTLDDLSSACLLQYQDGSRAFFSDIEVGERLLVPNFDSYMIQLSQGKAFGLISDIYSQREGSFALIDLPEEYQTYIKLIAVYKRNHPLSDMLNSL